MSRPATGPDPVPLERAERARIADDARHWASGTDGREVIVVIEPDPRDGRRLENDLRARGVRCEVFDQPWRALAHLGTEPAAVVIVSAGLGAEPLRQVAEAVLQETSFPVLIACDSLETAAIGPAVMLGARPVLGRPLDAHEVVTVARAVLPDLPRPERLEFEALSLVPEWQDALFAGVGLDLSRLEYAVLAELVRRAGRCAPRTALIEAAWGEREGGPDDLLTAAIKRLRIKLAAVGAVDAVRTVRGVGYRLDSSALTAAAAQRSISSNSASTLPSTSAMIRRTS